jgi:hypothetical protein
MGECINPDICSSCGFPIAGCPPSHQTGEPDHLDRIRFVCDHCWHDPALFFLPREMEIHGNYRAVLENQWRKYHGIPDGQMTFGSVVPDYAMPTELAQSIAGSVER